MDYTKERVRFVLVPDAPVGQAPPYKHWLLLGITDPTNNKPLNADEVARRMAKRTRK